MALPGCTGLSWRKLISSQRTLPGQDCWTCPAGCEESWAAAVSCLQPEAEATSLSLGSEEGLSLMPAVFCDALCSPLHSLCCISGVSVPVVSLPAGNLHGFSAVSALFSVAAAATQRLLVSARRCFDGGSAALRGVCASRAQTP